MHTSTQFLTSRSRYGSGRLAVYRRIVSCLGLMLMMMLFWQNSNAQLSSNYTFSQSSSGTYTPISGGTVFLNTASSTTDDVTSSAIALPSSFQFNGYTIDTIYINSNGVVYLWKTGNTVPTGAVTYTPISSGPAVTGVLSAFGADLQGSTVSGSSLEISHKLVGSEYVVQYRDWARYGNTANTRMNFQIRMNLCNGVIKFMYGNPMQNNSSYAMQVGLRGTNGSDYLNRTSTSGVWQTTSTNGGSNTATQTWSSSTYPANGGSYTYTPSTASAKVLNSISYNTTSVSNCAPGTNFNHLIRLDFDVSGLTGTLPINSIQVTSLNTDDADVSGVRLFVTSTSTFSTATQLGTTATYSGGTVTFGSLSYDLPCGITYVWLAYDVSSSATNGNTLDAKFMANSIDVGGSYYPSTQKSPAGSRTISSPMTFSSGSASQASTLFVQKGTTNQRILTLTLNMSASGATISPDTMYFTTLGSTNAGTDIQNATLYYTGNSSTFSTSTIYGSVVAGPNGTFKVYGYQTLNTGANYFHLTYDIKSTATTGDSVDARWTNVYIGGTNQTISSGDPAGFRTIRNSYCIPGTTATYPAFGVTNVTLGSINNTTSVGDMGYHDYMSMSTTVKKGITYTLSITAGTYTSGQNIAAWIDFNGDGDFYDAGEKIGEKTNMTASTPYDYVFTVPCSAFTGQTVLRVKHQYSTTNLDPCVTSSYVDVEDYILDIQDSALGYYTSLGMHMLITDVPAGAPAQILRVPVVMAGCSGTPTLTDFTFNTSGSTSPSGDIDSVVVYYTGNSNVYATTTRFGSYASPNGSFTVSGTMNLISDSNNFWVTYFVKGSATLGNVIDCQVNNIIINSNNHTPTVTSPTGSRTINSAMTFVQANAYQATTANVARSTFRNLLLRVEVDMSSGYSINATQLKLNFLGTTGTITNQIDTARVFYTGSSPVFAMTTQFGVNITGSGLTTNPYTLNGSVPLNTGTNYFWVVANCRSTAGLTDSIDARVTQVNAGGLNNLTVSDPAGKRKIVGAYCTKTWSTLTGLGITNVSLGDINNTSPNPPPAGQIYNYTSQRTSVQRLSSQTITVQTGTYTYYNYVTVWADWNQDGSFQNPAEKIGEYYTYTGGGSQYTVPFTFTVPCSAALGETRLRVLSEYYTSTGAATTGCGITGASYGEGEDYTLVITDSAQSYLLSTTSTPSTLAVAPGSTNNQILTLQVTTAGCTGPLNLTQLNLNTTGSTDPSSDIDSVKVFYTGTSATFATTTLVAADAYSSSPYSLTPSVALPQGTSYFHITYRISSSPAALGDVVDAQLPSLVVGGNTYSPVVSSPTGDRPIYNPMTYTSSTSTQPTLTPVMKNSTSNLIMGVEVVMSSGTPLNMDSISFSSTGTTSLADFNNMKLYYTGNSSSFGLTTLLSTVASSATTFKMYAGVGLVPGSNYFWLTYDIPTGATTGDSVDAVVNYVKIAGTSYTPSVTTVAGKRRVNNAYCTYSTTYAYTGMGIANFTCGSINNSSTANSASGANTYNYTSQATNVKRDGVYNYSITNGSYGYYNNISLWADWNMDGDWLDAGEKLAGIYTGSSSVANTAFTGTFSVPCNAELGSTRVRVIMEYTGGTYSYENGIACGGIYYNYYGEAEDYTFIVGDSAMNVSSVTHEQLNTTAVSQGSNNNEISRIRVNIGGCGSSLTLTDINLGTTGSTNASGDIGTAKVYYTGANPALSFSTLFGTVSSPSGSFTVSGTQSLLADSNFFYVTYDINGGATLGNVVDVQGNQVTVNSNNYSMSPTNPTGTRTIGAPMTYTSHTWTKDAGSMQKGLTYKMATLAITMSTGTSINPDSLVFTTGGSQNPSTNITDAKLFFTGSSSTFATTTQYGSTINTPSGNMNFSGAAALSPGVNYFHLQYAVSASANSSTPDSLTADLVNVYIDGSTYSPSPSSITGKRKIINQYCGITWTYSYSGMGITNVTLGTINNTTTASSNTGYNNGNFNYTSMSTNIKRKASHAMSISSGSYSYYNNISAWIDWNQNGTFDATEKIYDTYTGSTGGSVQTFNFNFTVPCSAALGTTQMRVIMEYTGGTFSYANGMPCGGIYYTYYGEAENYSVVIQDSALTVASVTTQQTNLTAVSPGQTKADIGRIRVITNGCGTNLTLTDLGFTTTGTTSASDLDNAKVYFTGGSSTYATTTQFGSTYTSPSGSFTISGTSTLLPDTNYYWLAYDINSGATTGGTNFADMTGANVTINSSNYTPTVQSPSGNRVIDNPMTYSSNLWTLATGSVQKGLTYRFATVKVTMSSGASINMDSLIFNTSGSQNPSSNISNAKVFYTGASSTYATTTQYGNTVNTPSGQMKFYGTQMLLTGDNYFHIQYTVSASANSSTPDSLTVSFEKGTAAGTDFSGNPTSISGKRKIINQYCSMSWTYSYTGMGIGQVIFGSINNTTNANSVSGSGAGNFDYTSMSTTIQKSGIYPMTVVTGTYSYYNNVSVWIDWNQNGTFDAADKVYDAYTGGTGGSAVTYNFNVTVPCSAATGVTQMRVIMEYTGGMYSYANGMPCGGIYYTYYGEAENYSVDITDAARNIVSIDNSHPTLVTVPTGSSNVKIQRTKINLFGCTPSFSLTEIEYNTTGTNTTNNSSGITDARVYYTTTSTFATTTQFGSAVSNPSGSITFSGTVSNLPDSSWLWLVYNLNGSSAVGDTLDAQVVDLTLNSSTQTPSNANPTGYILVDNPMTYVSSATDMPITSSMAKGTTNNSIVRLNIAMSATGYPIKIDSIYSRLLNYGSGTVSSNLQNAKLFFTGNSSSFATTTQFGSTIASPSGSTMLFSSSSIYLMNGNNYFWLTADVKTGATTGDSAYGAFDSLRVAVSSQTPSPSVFSTTKRRIMNAYCPTSGYVYSYSGMGITKVQLGSINNTTVGNSVAGQTFVDYTSQSTTLTKSQNYTIVVSGGSYQYYNLISAWIDYNVDGTFTSGEKLGEYYTGSTPLSNTNINFNFTVPCSALTGTTRLRAIMEYTGGGTYSASGCGGVYYYYYGEIEDYTVNIVDYQRTITGVTTYQHVTNDVPTGATNQQILKVKMMAAGCGSPLSLTQLDFNTTGTTNTSDITNAKVYYTGSSNTFSTSTLFGTVSSPSGSFSVTGTASIASDSSFAWLTYDVASGATLGNVLDAEGTVATISSSTFGSSSSFSGSRTINNMMSFVDADAVTVTNAVVYKGSTNQQIIRLDIEMSATGSVRNLTNLDLSTVGTTDYNDIQSAKAYYTGSSTTFVTSTQFGSTTTPAITFSFSGNQPLVTGMNYIFIVYNISSSATTNNYVDATFDGLDIDSIGGPVNYTPSTTSPSGSRKIINSYCNPTWIYLLTSGFGISNVQLGSINNTSAVQTTVSLNTQDYTSLSTTIQKGSSQTITVKTGTYNYYQNISTFIDWNQDGTFTAAERVQDNYVGSSGTGSVITFTNTFTVPCSAVVGTTRMRVITEYTGGTTPSSGGLACGGLYSGNMYYGEAEDYTVIVTDSTLTYITSTATTASTSDVFASSSDNQIIRMMVVMKGCTGTQNLTQFTLNTNGSTNASNDLSNAKVYYTGSSSTYATTTLYGQTSSPNGSFTVSGSQGMNPDTSYFWLAYDIPSGATVNNYVDGEFTDVTIQGSTYTPTTSAPSGNRMINTPATYNSSVVYTTTTSNINKGTRLGQICKLKVNMSSGAPTNLTSITVSTAGSYASNLNNDVDSVRIYYTGSSNSFATSTQFGAYSGSVTSPFNVTGSQPVSSGDNYFWVVYKIKSTATTNDSVRGTVTSITVNSSSQTPTDSTNGKRRIIPAYCTGPYTSTYSGMYLYKVIVGSISNTTPSQPTTPYYSDFTSISTNLQLGTATTLTAIVGTYTNQYVAAWIDYNQDGDFYDAGEKLGEMSMPAGTTTTNSFTFTPPITATLGETRMRVRSVYGTTALQPCNSYSYGETEDYSVVLTAPAAPTPSITPTSSSFCLGTGQVFTNSNLTSTHTYVWKVNSSTVSSGTGSPYNQFNFNPGSTGTYTVQLFVTDAFGQTGSSNTVSVTVNPSATAGTVTASSPSICSGDADTLTVSGGTGTRQWQYRIGTGSWTNFGSGGTQEVVNPTSTTQYRCSFTLGSCGTVYSNTVTVSLGSTFVWNGAVSTDWRNALNWCNGTVPGSSSVVVIPLRTNQPELAGNGACSTLTISSGATLTLNVGANLVVNGLFTNSGTLTHNGGIFNLNSPQTVPGGNYFYLRLTGTSGEYKFKADATINSTFEIGSGTTVNDSGKTISCKRDIINNGTHKGSGKVSAIATGWQTVGGTGSFGNFDINVVSNSYGVRFAGNTTIDKLLSVTVGTVIINPTSTLTIGSTSTSTGNITFGTGTSLLSGSSVTNSNLNIYGNSSAAQITNLRVTGVGNLTINRSNGVKMGTAMTVRGTLTLNGGKLRMNGNNLTVGSNTSTTSYISTSGTGRISNNSTSAGWFNILGTSSCPGSISNLMLDSQYNMQIRYPLGITLGNSFRVANLVYITGGMVDLNGYTVTLSTTGSLSEAVHNLFTGSTGTITTTRSLGTLTNSNVAGLGMILSTNQSMGNTTIIRGHTLSSQSGSSSVSRYYQIQPSNYSGLIYTNMEFRFDSIETNASTSTSTNHMIAKNTTAGASSGWIGLTQTSATPVLGTPYGYQWASTSMATGASNQVFTVFDYVGAGLSPVFVQNNDPVNNTEESGSVSAWPNPFNQEINLSYSVTTESSLMIVITDMSGKQVSTQVVKAQKGNNNYKLNTEELPSGIYMINLMHNNEMKTIKMVKTN